MASEAPPAPPSSGSIEFPPSLPISSRVADIARAIHENSVVIVAGATGSGKTTQLPKIALAMGRGLEKVIGVTQPRRIAATSVAARVASELGSPLGTDVGYQVRFDDRTSAATYVKFMTDGILLAEIHGDPLLRKYDTLIIDEAHERSLTIDFLLGYLKRILPERPDLKVIVSSATIEHERFSEFFGGAPVLQVEGRTFPVEVLYEPPAEETDLAVAVADAVENVTRLDPHGDILVFFPGEREIREAESELVGRRLRHTVIQPLYGRLEASAQQKVFTSISERRVVLATNVAETSITIPGIVYVIDTGSARLSRYDGRSGTTRLHVEGISQASADQRKGRCGRVREGVCIRLFDEASFQARPAYTDPEIKRTGLAGVILRMKALDLGDVESFPFLDPPDKGAIAEGYRVLEELGALTKERTLTAIGRELARFPVDPRIARMVLAGRDLGCLEDVLVVAAALNVQDVRERPREHLQKADDLHRRFRDEQSDFVGILKLWDFVREAESKGTSHLRRVCRESFLSFLRIREWRDVHRQLEELCQDLKVVKGAKTKKPTGTSTGEQRGLQLSKALLTGLLSKIGQWNPETRTYVGAKQTRFVIHPSSALARKNPQWMMAFELVDTSQLFARMAAKIEPEWLAELAPHLLRTSYGEAHWSERTARAVVKEHGTLFGLTVYRDRNVDYSRIEPARARLLFLDHALVRGEFETRGAFQKKNRELLEHVATLRAKARKSDMLSDDDALLAFFDARVPSDVTQGKDFEAWRTTAEGSDPNLLVLRLEDVLAGESALRDEDFPDSICLHGATLPLRYVFDPARDDDGITVTLPLVLVPQIRAGELDGTVPGALREKVYTLLRDLSKGIQRDLKAAYSAEADPLYALATAVARRIAPLTQSGKPIAEPFLPALSAAIEIEADVHVPPSAFRLEFLPPFQRLLLRIVDGKGKVVGEGRDADALLERFGMEARAAFRAAAPVVPQAKAGLTAWTFGDLLPHVVRQVGGATVRSYPALVDRETSVEFALLEAGDAAELATRGGVRRLVLIAHRLQISSISARLPRPLTVRTGLLPKSFEDAARRALLHRIVDEAYRLDDGPIPRNKTDFDALLNAGIGRLQSVFQQWHAAIGAAALELTKALTAMQSAAKHPGAKLALGDLHEQLTRMLPEDLYAHVPFAVLQQFPRYFRAMPLRLGRAITDPRKDSAKLEPLTPALAAFVKKRAASKTPNALAWHALRWDLEELRVAIFAPELKNPYPVSLAKWTAALAALA